MIRLGEKPALMGAARVAANDGRVGKFGKGQKKSRIDWNRSGIALFIHRNGVAGYAAVHAVASNFCSGRSSDLRFVLLAASSQPMGQ